MFSDNDRHKKARELSLRAFSSLSPGLSGITGDLFGLAESELVM